MPLINWKKVNFSEERGEFERVTSDFSPSKTDKKYKKEYDENFKAIQQLYGNANLVFLTRSIWQNLENTESYNTNKIEDIQKAIRTNASSSGSRSIENVLKEYMSYSVRAPIVLSYENGASYQLIAGNTRLMVAKMLDVQVKVVLVKSDW